jgi:single-strand DNA-binding protein
MINRVIIVGRLTADPSLRYTAGGVAVCSFTLAVNRPFTNQKGKREADFIQCVAWRKAGENVANFLRKGNLVGVDGRLQTRSYEGQDGKRVYVTEVVADSVQFLEPKGKGSGEQKDANTGQIQATTSVYGVADPLTGENGGYADPFTDSSIPIDDRDLPF